MLVYCRSRGQWYMYDITLYYPKQQRSYDQLMYTLTYQTPDCISANPIHRVFCTMMLVPYDSADNTEYTRDTERSRCNALYDTGSASICEKHGQTFHNSYSCFIYFILNASFETGSNVLMLFFNSEYDSYLTFDRNVL